MDSIGGDHSSNASLTTNIVLVGPAARIDTIISQTLNRTWFHSTLFRAPTYTAAARLMASYPESGYPIEPDLLILKLPDPAVFEERDIRRIRQYKVFRDVPVAVLVDQDAGRNLRCLRGSGLNLVLTLEDLDTRRPDLRDAVIDYWMKSYCDDCNERYFCAQTDMCSKVGVQNIV